MVLNLGGVVRLFMLARCFGFDAIWWWLVGVICLWIAGCGGFDFGG